MPLNLNDFSISLLSEYGNVAKVFHYEGFSVEERTCNFFGNLKNFVISKFGLGSGRCAAIFIRRLDCHILQ